MTLKERLDRIKLLAQKKIPSKIFSEMLKASDDLRLSGMLERMVKSGGTLPPFILRNQDGIEISSETLLRDKNLVIAIFRGHW